ncbi:DUF2269 domain-containing protein [Capillimicrobium parvum]|uniref:DUF2269 family protein n=1 Tax=Capillimicrobium parvum TaxID=2884022 RepID=A0A9E7BZ45_9ACTN|nr:DUF2269 domain-containing protein [Capillimicrobium parvum]UGS34184.1 hypothetical protein DSM104329_00557 [Capillimicrobium parvum]
MTAPFAVTGFEISLFLHITAAIVGFGSTFAEALLFPVAQRMGQRYLPFVHQIQIAINRTLATPALVIVLATGIYQVSEANYSFGDLWISASFVIIIVLGGLLGAYFVPTDKRLGAMVERELAAGGGGEVQLSEDYQRAARTEGMIGALAGLLVVVAVFLMVVKPGA